MSENRVRNVREPSEIEAWKLMMDSMVKFIAASTKLMKTISTRAETVTPIDSGEFKNCEVECIMCPTRSAKECGVCAAGKPLDMSKVKAPSTKSSSRPTSPAPPTPAAPVQESTDAPTADPSNDAATETPAEEPAEAPPEPPAEESSEPPAEEPAEPPAEAPPDQAAGEAEAPKEAEAGSPTEADDSGEPAKPSEADVSQAESKKNYCVCPEIKIIKQEAEMAGVDVDKKRKKSKGKNSGKDCRCTGKGKKEGKCGSVSGVVDGETKSLCACAVGNAEQEQMTLDLANKLNQAQENLSMLQKEMARLQQLDALKNSQSAALYREIMKDSALDKSIGNKSGGPSSAPSSIPASVGGPQAPIKPRYPSSSRSSGSAPSKGFPAKPMALYDNEACDDSSCVQKRSFRSTSKKQGHMQTCPGPCSPILPIAQSYRGGLMPDQNTSMYKKPPSEDRSSAFYTPSKKSPPIEQYGDDFYSPGMDEAFVSPCDRLDHNIPDNTLGSYQDASSCNAFIARQNISVTKREPRPQQLFAPKAASSDIHTPTISNPYGQPALSNPMRRNRYYPSIRPDTNPQTSKRSSGQRIIRGSPMAPYLKGDPNLEHENVCPGVCYTGEPQGEYMEPESHNDFLNPDFGAEEFPDDGCYDDNCEEECYLDS